MLNLLVNMKVILIYLLVPMDWIQTCQTDRALAFTDQYLINFLIQVF